MPLPLTPEVQTILNTLESAGYEVFVVGGCVRDLLRGIAPKDWDVTTSAGPHQVKSLFTRTFDTGLAHGTVTVLENSRPFEVTTYRIDGPYSDARRPDNVIFAAKIEEDLSRRDFTVNAIAYNPTRGFVDPWGGRVDIERRIIRAVGDPVLRFSEDALRMLRAVRFAGTMGFTVDTGTLAAISHQAKNLVYISAERIREELTRLVCSPHPDALTLLTSTGLMPYVLQGLPYPGDLDVTITHLKKWHETIGNPSLTHTALTHYGHAESTCSEYIPLTLFFAPFTIHSSNQLPTLLRRLRFDNITIKAISLYSDLLPHPITADRYEIKKHLRAMPSASAQASFNNLLYLQEITQTSDTTHLNQLRQINKDIHANQECYSLKTLAVNGSDLTTLGIPPGKKMGEILQSLLDAVMHEPKANKKNELLTKVRLFS